MYLPGDINGLAKKLQFFAGNTTVRNELVHVLDALLRLKQLTRKEYADITARLAVCTIGSLLARYATKAMLDTAAKAALKG